MNDEGGLVNPAVPEESPLKRAQDFLLASLGLVMSAPLWLVFATLIKLEDRGPLFYSQQRWGRNKKRLRVHKFRTMIPDSDRIYGAMQSGEDDPRITRVGKLLRATALDELPQLLNIWKGEMSFVGPRALPINEVQQQEKSSLPDEDIPGFDLRCQVRPGLTGIAQIYAPRDVPRRHKFKYDLVYIKNQSAWLDLRLILVSFWITFKGKWEAREGK